MKMTIVDLMAALQDSGVKLSWQGEQLKCQLPKGGISQQLKQQLIDNKEQVKTFVKNQQQAKSLAAIERQSLTQAPLSNAQASIWFVDFIQGGSPQFNLPAAFSVLGVFDLDAAEQALSQIIERHEALRTVFKSEQDAPIQVVQAQVDFALKRFDLSHLPPTDAMSAGRDLVIADRDKVFDLQQDLMLRAGFIQLPAQDGQPYGLMYINAHHIVADGWSMAILTHEFVTLYSALVKQQPANLPLLQIQFTDYVMWQQQKLQGEQMQSSLAYWQQLLADAPACHQLPMDRPRSDRPVKGGIVRSDLAVERFAELNKLNRATDTTLFMLLQAALAVHIGRLSCETDVMIGAPNAGRLNQTLESMIGMFVNTQVFRSQFDQKTSFKQLLAQTKRQHLESARHLHVTFEAIVEDLQPVRINHCPPLFQILLNFDNAEQPEVELEGLSFTPLDGSDDIDNKYDITLYVYQQQTAAGATLEFKWVYDARLFDQDTMLMFANEFEHLLAQLVQAPEQAVLSHAWAEPQAELQKVTPLIAYEATNDTTNHHVMGLFEHQAEINPEQIALSFIDKDLSYQQLNQQVNQMAEVLSRDHDIAQVGHINPRVAIAITRSEHRVIAMLAVMKLGGCFIPLSDEVPVSRWHKLLELSEAQWVLTDALGLERLQAADADTVSGARVIGIDDPSFVAATNEASIDNPPAPTFLGQDPQAAIAHIIFTSGSTGEPKGVLGTYQALYHRIDWMLKHQAFVADETMAHITSMAFIRSVWELFTPLCAGARLLLCPRDMVRQPDELWPYLAKQKVTRMVCAPSLMKSLHQLHLMAPSVVDVTLKHWYVSGEPMLMADAHAILSTFNDLSLYNMYGATEVMSAITCAELSLQHKGRYAVVGQPIDGVSIVVETPKFTGRPVPQGVIGELVVYGPTVAAGYLPSQMASVANNGFFSTDKLFGFRTGDYGRLLGDGQIEVIGRKDDQVKIRGFRIELAEIEHCLSQDSDELPCKVLSSKVLNVGTQLMPSLAAYVVIEQLDQQDQAQLKTLIQQQLKQQLPSYMVPSHLVLLAQWPLKANGKIDRSALPNTFAEHSVQAKVNPVSELECSLAGVWAKVLKLDVDTVGIEHDFFELGGHSLLLVSLQNMIQQQLAVTVKVKDLFQYSTITAQVKLVEKFKTELRDDASLQGQYLQVSAVDWSTSDTQHLPLSFAQQRLWLVDKIQQGSPQYNMPRAFMVKGHLDLDSLTLAMERIIRRHQVLRTTYVEKGDSLVSCVKQDFEFSLYFQDLTSLGRNEQDSTLRQLIMADAEASFDLTSDLMLRVSVVKLTDESSQTPRFCIVFNQHHIASDGWSLNLLCQEFVVQYQAAVKGLPDPLPPLPLQYCDYAHWQRQWLQGEVLQQQLGYWQQQLDDLPQCHNLPLDFARPANKGHQGRKYSVQLGPDFAESIQSLAKKYQLTPFMLLHGTLALVISRYSYRSDIVIGTPVANRQQQELAQLMGFFVNTLVLRVDTEQSDLASYFEHVKAVNLGAQDHQDVPFEYLVEQTKVVRSKQYSPLFQILFTLNTLEQVELEVDGLTIDLIEDHDTAVKFDLDINVQLTDNGVLFNWVYDVNLFAQSSIEAMCGQYLSLLQKMLDSQDDTWQSLACEPYVNTLGSSERASEQVCCELPTIHRLFEQQAAANPHQIAVEMPSDSLFEQYEQLSYQQLNTRANQLAHYLRSQDVSTGSLPLVALCFERSIDMVVSILAVLKAGAAYVPIDPSLPQNRRDFMLQDTAAKVVLTASSLASLWQGCDCDVNSQVVCVDQLNLAQYDNTNLADGSQHLAYVIYTSGSTGQPKGVMMGHQGLSNRLAWMQQQYGLTPQDKVLQKTPYSFDVSVWEFLWTLGYGATIVMAKPQGHKDPAYLQQLIAKHEVSVLHFVPSMLSVYLDNQSELAPSVRYVFCSGEALTSKQVSDLQQLAPHVALHNLYGPTEAAIDVSYFDCENFNTSDYRDQVPIGRAIDNVELLVLDKQLNIAPAGAVGQLYIGGVALAQGYLNRDELSAQTFIQHPFATDSQSNVRLYRTGDLVRQVKGVDGGEPVLLYLGRIDNQLKIRGFRIELGEIEQQLMQHSAVDSACVIAQGCGEHQQLVAYAKLVDDKLVDGEQQHQDIAHQLKAALKASLPEYMCPQHYVLLEQWPLTHNGKLDRKALPAIEFNGLEFSNSETEYIEPKGAVALSLVDIWAELLDLAPDTIGEQADFFALGGHSLLAARMIAQVGLKLAVEIPLAAVFEHPLLGQLASLIESTDKSISTIVANADLHQLGAVAPASFAQQRLWFIEQLNPNSSEYHIPAAMQINGDFDLATAEQAMSAIVKRHLSLRSQFFQQDDKVWQRIGEAQPFKLKRFDLTNVAANLQQAQVATIMADFNQRAFDLSTDLLVRAGFVQLDSQQGILLLCVHHIAADGWSMSNLSDEFVKLYRGSSDLRPEDLLLELDLQYVDFAHQQQQWLDDEKFTSQQQYWRELLADAPVCHQLPLDRPRDEAKPSVSGQVTYYLTVQQWQQLNQLLARTQSTVFMFMQCALALHIGRMSGQTDVVLGAPNGGRDDARLEPLIGLFLNTQVYRTQFSDNPTFTELLAATKAQHLTSNEYQKVPFELIVEAVNPPRDLAISPIFQVLINHINFDAASEQLDELTITPMVNQAQNKYDITLYLQQLADGSDGGDSDKAFALNYVYDANLFDASTMALFATEFDHLLSQIVAAPQTPVLNFDWQHQAPMLTGVQRSQELSGAMSSLAAMFQQQAQSKADHIAYVDDELSLTFAQLNQQANQLSQVLAQYYGVSKGTRVAVATLRNVNHVVALLALVKLGACYLPLTDELPQGRLEYMLNAAGVQLVISESAFGQITSVLAQYPQIQLDDQETKLRISEASLDDPQLVELAPDDSAHIIFTSGTTGLPKAVEGNYLACVNRVQWMLQDPSFGFSADVSADVGTEDSAMCHITAFGFIRSVWELLTPLCGGVRLVMCQRELLLQPDVFAQFLVQHQVSTMVSAPSLLAALVSHFSLNQPSDIQNNAQDQASFAMSQWPIKHWFVSGEPLLSSLAVQACECFADTQFYNLYGSTEVMSDVLCYQIEPQSLTANLKLAQIPLGKPIDNVQILVLGPDLQVLPAGVRGELVIFGDAIANGYLATQDSSNTTEQAKFVETQWGRGYRSGDVATIGEDGLLYCHGRIDDQVQIRGHRVELAEIEHQLLALAAVKAAKVIAIDNHLSELVLVAYIQPEQFDELSAQDGQWQQQIINELQLSLPSYMLPTQLIAIEKMPLRPNGKVDTSQLPPALLQANLEYVAPQTPTEIAMSEIWSELLLIDAKQISREADFFALGGHSLLTIKLITAIKARFEVEPQVKTVFEHKTLAALAETVEQAVIVKQSEQIHSDTEVEEGWL